MAVLMTTVLMVAEGTRKYKAGEEGAVSHKYLLALADSK